MANNIEQRWANIGLTNELATSPAAEVTTGSGGLAGKVFALNDARQAKMDSLVSATNDKSNGLQGNTEGYEDVTITGMEDADTAVLADGRKVRIGDPLTRYDAVEIRHPEQEDGIWNRVKNTLGIGGVNKSDYAEDTQKRAVARMLGKQPTELTNQDMIDVGNMQQVQALADLTRGKDQERWEAPLVRGVGQVDLNSGLDVKAKMKVAGKDEYGRVLGSFVNPETGIDVTKQLAEDPNQNAFARENVNYGFTRDDKGVRVDTLDTDGYMGNLVDAVQSGIGTRAAKIGDTVADAALRLTKEYMKADGSTPTEQEVNKKIVDKVAGTFLEKVIDEKANFTGLDKYEKQSEYGYTDKRIKEYVSELKDTYTDPESTFVDKALVTLKGVVHGPEVLASSSADIALAMTGVPGFAAMAASETNDILEERQLAKGTQDLEASDYGIATAAGVLYSAVNMLTKGNVGLADAKKVITEAAKSMDASAFATVTGKLVKDGVGEGVEEIFQGAVEVVGQKLDTPKQEQILTEETALDLAAQGALGFGGGVTGAVIGELKPGGSISTAAGELVDKTKDLVGKKEAIKESDELTADEVVNIKKQADAVFDKFDAGSMMTKEGMLTLRDLEEKAYRIPEKDPEKEMLLQAIKETKAELVKNITELDDVAEYSKVLGSKEAFLDTLDDVMESTRNKIEGKLEDNLKKIAESFGITNDMFLKIKKDYESVDLEATKSSRGYMTQGKALRSILDTSNPDTAQVDKLVKQMKRFESSQDKWVKAYDSAKTELEAEVNGYNADITKGMKELTKAPKAKTVKVSENSKFTINVEKLDNGKYKVSDALDKTYEAKKANIAGIRNEFSKSKEFFKRAGIKQADTGVQTSPVIDAESISSLGLKKAVAATKKDFEKNGVTAIISMSNEDPRNKHIVADNEQIVNKDEYNKDDVVAILLPQIKTQKEFDAFIKQARNKKSKLRQQIMKAQEAGATIVIDNNLAKFKGKAHKKFDYTNDKGVTTKKSVREVLVNQLTSFSDIKYESELGKRVFKTKADMAKSKEDKKKEEDTKAKKQEVLDAAFEKFANDEEVTYTEEIASYFKAEDKFRAYLENRLEKEVSEYVKLATEANRMHNQISNLTKKAESKELVEEADAITASIDKLKAGVKTRLLRMKELAAVKKIAEDKLKDVVKKAGDSKNILRRYNEAKKSDEITGENTAEEIMNESEQDVVARVLDNSISKGAKDYESKDGIKYYLDINKVVRLGKDGSVLNLVDVVDMFDSVETEAGKVVSSEEYIDKAKTFVDKTITQYKSTKEYSSGTTDLEFTLKDSPAYGLLFDKEGQVNDVTVMAMKLAVDEYVSYKGSTLSPTYKSREDVAQMVGVLDSQLGKNQYVLLKDKGVFKKTMDNEVGKAVLKKMGLAKASGIEEEMFNRVAAELGQIAGMIAEDAGVIEYTDVSVKEYQDALAKDNGKDMVGHSDVKGDPVIKFARFTKGKKGKKNEEVIDDVIDVYEAIHSTLGDESSFRKEPSRRPITKGKRRHVKEQVAKDVTGAKIPTGGKDKVSSLEALNNLIDTEWRYDRELVEQVRDMDRDVLLKWLGFKTEDELENMSYIDRESQVANNRDIQKNLDELLKLDGDDALYFDWFFSSNGRYMMDSNTVNPQTEKQLHRWLVTPSKHTAEYKVKDGKFTSEGKDVTDVVKYALAQSMGFATDKKSTSKINEFAEALLGLSKEELAEAKKEVFEKGKAYEFGGFEIEPEHIGHTLQGFKFLEQVKSGRVVSNLSAEFDAVTSGFGLKLLQMPILKGMSKDRLAGIVDGEGALGTMWYWLNKVGVFKNAQLGEYRSMNDVLDSKGFYEEGKNFYDSYQSLAVDMNIKANELDPKNSIYKNVKLMNVVPMYKGIESALPTLDASGTVSKMLRNMFKDPFMTFNYSAGIRAIRASLANKMANDLIAGIVSEKPEFKEVTEFLAKQTRMKPNVLVQMLRAEPLNSIPVGKLNLEDVLLKTLDVAYGNKVEEIMTKNFEEFMNTHKSINDAFKAMFSVFNVKYKAELAKVPSGELTSEKKLEIIERLRKEFPVIKGPLSSDIDEGIHIYGTESVTPAEGKERQTPAQTYVKGKEFKSSKARFMIREFEAAISSGSVVPIHFIDGAVMGQLLGKGSAITAVHDAIIPPLTQAKDMIKKYNENMVKIGKEYSIIEAINEMLNRNTFTEEDIKELNGAKINVARVNEEGKKEYVDVGVGTNLEQVKKEFGEVADKVKKAREALFKDMEAGVTVGHMAGLPGSMWSNVEVKEEPKQEAAKMSRLDKIQQEIGALFPVTNEMEAWLDELTEEQLEVVVENIKNCI